MLIADSNRTDLEFRFVFSGDFLTWMQRRRVCVCHEVSCACIIVLIHCPVLAHGA